MVARITNITIKVTVSLIMIATLTACSRDISDLESFIAQTKTKYIGSVEPIPEFIPYQVYSYSAFEERDPFLRKKKESFEEQTTNDNSAQPDRERRKEPLEYFPLDALTMVGTLEQRGSVWGLVKDPDGAIHTVKPGNYLGENFGEIIRVTETKVEILEVISDGLGTWVEREIALTLGE